MLLCHLKNFAITFTLSSGSRSGPYWGDSGGAQAELLRGVKSREDLAFVCPTADSRWPG